MSKKFKNCLKSQSKSGVSADSISTSLKLLALNILEIRLYELTFQSDLTVFLYKGLTNKYDVNYLYDLMLLL